jgi:hypothetical protein
MNREVRCRHCRWWTGWVRGCNQSCSTWTQSMLDSIVGCAFIFDLIELFWFDVKDCLCGRSWLTWRYLSQRRLHSLQSVAALLAPLFSRAEGFRPTWNYAGQLENRHKNDASPQSQGGQRTHWRH